MGFSASIILFFLLIVAMVIVAVSLRARRTTRATAPSCGSCGYEVAGLDSLRCPECGSDLRQVGIVTPQMNRPIGPVTWSLVWTLMLPIPALFISALIGRMLPQQVTQGVIGTLSQPISKAYTAIDIRDAKTALSSGASSHAATFSITKLDASMGPQLRVVFPVQSFEIDGTTQNGGAAIKSADILAWMGSAGIDVTDPAVVAEADEVMAQVGTLASGVAAVQSSRHAVVSSGGTFTIQPVLPAYPIIALSFWVVVWILGLVFIIRRHRRVMA